MKTNEFQLTATQVAILACTTFEEVLQYAKIIHEKHCDAIRSIAACVVRIRQLGRDPKHYKLNMPYAEKIIAGTLSVELVAQFGNRSKLMRKAIDLDTDDQIRLANNEPVRVLEANGDARMVPAFDLTDLQIAQVIGHGTFRTDTEQAQWLSDMRKRSTIGMILDDPVQIIGNCLVVNSPVPVRFSRKRLRDILAELDHRSTKKSRTAK